MADAFAQTTAFNYQGRLTDAGSPANGNYQMQFKLFDALSGGSQIGATISDVAVTVAQGVFNTSLDFGSSAFSGADRFLEIAVRRNSGDPYTVINPRQQIASSPYSIRTLSAQQADLSLDSQKLGGLNASEYVTNATLSTNFIRNQTTQQASSNFNISGSGTIGGSLNVNGAFPNGFYLSNGTANLRGTIVGNSVLFGTTTNSPLTFFSSDGTNNGSLLLDTTGNVGINSVTPETKLTVRTFGSDYGITHTNGSIRLTTYLGGNFNGGYFGTRSNHPLHFFTNDSGPLMSVTTNGDVGIGTTAPNAKLFVQGEASNGVGIAATGNASQSLNKGGWIKAMVFVLANGTIARCYNGLTGSSTGNCGFSVTYSSLHYIVDFGFQVSDRFASLTTSSSGVPIDTIAARINRQFANNNQIAVYVWNTRNDNTPVSDFHLIVY
jgi:hypothetical protein